ncbi:hypothetical protein V493_00093 [Pseudogymnoascus sp. VKM F-4281 (FW-2241)]|nr:hypothetical protein V493_00093 [Pseudogymnoascus sp. VKM F-4281 (FW-2241)]
MPDLINGVHLQAEQLDDPNIMKAIEAFAEWVVASEFKPLSPGLERCFDEEREDKIGPLVNAIGSGNGPGYQILRTTDRKYVKAGTAYLVPIRIIPDAKPTISDTGTTTTELKLGTKIFIDKPIYVDKDVYFTLITRKQD